MSPIIRDQEPGTGAILTLTFEKHVPALSASQVKALLAPLISFDLKTPIQAFTDTLPPKLKDAILNHQVLVGMSTEMLVFAKGQPETKTHEMDGNMPFDEWIYGKSPNDVVFVRINGNRVIRVEVARMGKKPEVFTQDEVAGLMRTDGSPLALGAGLDHHGTSVGDVARDPDTQAPAPPPTLIGSGEAPTPSNGRDGVMKPVIFPKAHPDPVEVQHREPQPGANPDGEPEAQPPADQQAPPADGAQPGQAPAPQQPTPSQPN
jgi:hypothetical protein